MDWTVISKAEYFSEATPTCRRLFHIEYENYALCAKNIYKKNPFAIFFSHPGVVRKDTIFR